MENPDPHRYRKAMVSLELEDFENRTYRVLLSRGRIAGRSDGSSAAANGTLEDRFWSGTRPIGSAMT
jgi:hypothetical protein